MKLYLDMDGVLMDFDGELQKRGLENNKTFLHLPKAEWTQPQLDIFTKVIGQMNLEDFWRSIPPISDAHQLWTYCSQFDFDILTAVPPRELNPIVDAICDSKLQAIWKNFDPTFPAERVLFCRREEKQKLAASHAILVDDMPGNCQEWTTAGGIAILHESAADSIEKIRSIMQ